MRHGSEGMLVEGCRNVLVSSDLQVAVHVFLLFFGWGGGGSFGSVDSAGSCCT